MKKKTVRPLLLFVLPLLTVVVAANPSGVTVFDGETPRFVSWLQTVPESPWGWCAPVAALMNYVVFALAVIHGLTKKLWCVKGIAGITFAAGCIAVLPIVIKSDVLIIPNVLGTILLCAEGLLAYIMVKKPAEKQETKNSGKRLERR